jgi:hypothetical protein
VVVPDPLSVPFAPQPFGFRWGAAMVERFTENMARYGEVVLTIETAGHRLLVEVSPDGEVQVRLDDREMRTDAP